MQFTLYFCLASAALAAPPVEEQGEFLRTAKIVATRDAPGGVTQSKRVTLSDGTLTHDAHVQTVHRSKADQPTIEWLQKNFVDSYTGNIAAYKLDRLLGLNMTPVSVERAVDGVRAAVTWWVDDVMMTATQRIERDLLAPDAIAYREQSDRMKVFDELIGNKDRNSGNILITRDWRLVMIDHTRAFTWSEELLHPDRMQFCDRRLFAALKGLDRKSLKKELGPSIKSFQVDALMKRRDKIVAHFEKLAAAKGEAAVFYGDADAANRRGGVEISGRIEGHDGRTR